MYAREKERKREIEKERERAGAHAEMRAGIGNMCKPSHALHRLHIIWTTREYTQNHLISYINHKQGYNGKSFRKAKVSRPIIEFLFMLFLLSFVSNH